MLALLRVQCGVWRRKLRFPVRITLTGFGIGAWFGKDIGIAAFGTAISGWLPFGVLGVLSIWLIYYFGKRAIVALLKHLKRAAIRGLDALVSVIEQMSASDVAKPKGDVGNTLNLLRTRLPAITLERFPI
jgi:hypothetical protein